MTKDLTEQKPPLDFSNLEKVQEIYRAELQEGRNRLMELIDEAPKEYRDAVAKSLLTIELNFYLEKTWTYDLPAKTNAFPELREYLTELFNRAIVESSGRFANSTFCVQASSEFKVSSVVWQQGGQGALHKAHDMGVGNRDVVIKFLKERNQLDQFEREALVTAKLDHPGIVAVYSKSNQDSKNTGGPHDRPFYVMRLVHGISLDEKIGEFHKRHRNLDSNAMRSNDFKSLIEILISICNIVEYAHSRGVLHCDIKPANIKCGEFDANYLLDWGAVRTFDLAKHREKDTKTKIQIEDWTADSYTVQFCSPEQMAREVVALTPASDVHALGATLFSVITGRPPHSGSRLPTETVVSPRSVTSRVSKRLSAICEKATAYAPAARYSNAADLASDLRNWLQDENVSAKPDNPIDRLFRLTRRHKTLAASAIVLTLLGITAAILVNGYKRRSLDDKFKHYQTRDAAFKVIEEICEPMSQDVVGGNKEFKRIADDLETFSDEYISVFANRDNDSEFDARLAKAHQFKAYANHFRYNNPDAGAEESRMEFLDEAIKELDLAVECAEDLPVDRASCKLLKARYEFKKMTGRESKKVFDESLSKINEATAELASILLENAEVKPAINLADAVHLKGELYLKFRGREFDDRFLEESSRAFADSVERRKKIHGDYYDNNPPEIQNLILREIGRGYGYLGDAQKVDPERIRDSIVSYEESLKARKKLADNDSYDEEYQFQLARGYANFGNLVRDNADRLKDFEARLRNDPELQEFNQAPFEILVIEKYVAKSKDINARLNGFGGDDRYKSDLVGIYNLLAELNFLASVGLPDADVEQRDSYLDEATKYGQKVQKLYPVATELKPSECVTLATSKMLLLQVALAKQDKASVESLINEIKSLLKPEENGFAKLDYQSLFAYCVCLQAKNADEFKDDQAFKRLKDKYLRGANYRFNKHFQSVGVPDGPELK